MSVLPACMYGAHVCAWCHRGDQRALDALGLELQTVVSQRVVLGIEPGSSARANKCS